MITAIVFDFFGVICSEIAVFWFGERFPDEVAKRMKDECFTLADRGDIDEEEVFKRLSAISGDDPKEIERDFYSRAIINKDTVALIERLKENNRVSLLSNAMANFLHRILRENDLYRLFETMVISGEEHVIKPEPEIFELLLSRMGVSAGEAVFIDDNPKNVAAARAIGMHAILFETAEGVARELRDLGVNI